MITFEHISIEGFASYGKSFFYVLNRPGINVIQGKNGSGKTTIFSALTWCLFGQTLKGKSNVEPWEDVVTQNFKGTRVEVALRVGNDLYVISRNKGYTAKQWGWKNNSGLFLTKNKIIQNQFRNKDDVQEEVVKILGMSFTLFKNSISFGQNLTRLLQEAGPKQKEIFDEAFEVMFINKARVKAVKFQKEQDGEYLKLKTEHDLLTEKLDNYENQIQSKEETQKEREQTKSQIIAEISKNNVDRSTAITRQGIISAKRSKRESYKRKVERLKELEDREFRIDFAREQDRSTLNAIIQEFRDIRMGLSKINPTCNTCGQEIKIEGRAKYKTLQISRLKLLALDRSVYSKKIFNAELKLAEIQRSKSKLVKFKDKLKRIETLLDSKENSTRPIHEYKATRLELRKRLKELKVKISADLEEANQLNFKRNKLLERELFLLPQLKQLEKGIKLHNWLINDPLSNKGLKTFIFNSMLGLINKRLRYYGRYLGYVIEFHIDMESGNKNFKATVQSGNKIRPYNDLSGGQKQLVDICLAFSIHDVVTETKKVNILLMDEIFESLDIDNVELVSELISVKSQGISTHLISHQQSLNFSRVANTLQLEIRKGITHTA